MKSILFSLVPVLVSLTSTFSAQANPLQGPINETVNKTLSCRVDRKELGAVENVTYKFFRAPSHLRAEVKSDQGLDQIAPYAQIGNGITVELNQGNTPQFFDISNPQDIRSSEQFCIRPGQMGGDTRTICVTADTVCVLN